MVKGLSPTQRTLKQLRSSNIICDIVERFIPMPPHGIRKDLFGIIDIIALDWERGVVGIQSCGSNFSEHFKKLTEEKYQQTYDWLKTPNAFLQIWGWRKVKKVRGGKAMVWKPRIKELTIGETGEIVGEDFV